MTKATARFFFLSLLSITLVANAAAWSEQTVPLAPVDDSINVFWEKFRSAVIKGDKAAVAMMSQFPISMPYGMTTVKNRAQLLRRYREVFHHETSAAKCVTTAKPVVEAERPKGFTAGCKNSAGHEVIIYSFVQTKTGWKFNGLDYLNE